MDGFEEHDEPHDEPQDQPQEQPQLTFVLEDIVGLGVCEALFQLMHLRVEVMREVQATEASLVETAKLMEMMQSPCAKKFLNIPKQPCSKPEDLNPQTGRTERLVELHATAVTAWKEAEKAIRKASKLGR